MSASRIVPILLFVALALAAALVHELMGKKNEILDGVIVQDLTTYEFYLGHAFVSKHIQTGTSKLCFRVLWTVTVTLFDFTTWTAPTSDVCLDAWMTYLPGRVIS